MGLGRDDLVISTGVLGNPPVELVCEAAVAGGFRGVAIWPHDLQRLADEGRTPQAFRRCVEDAGLVVDHVDAVFAWAHVSSTRRLRASEEARWLDVAVALGARCLGAHPQVTMPPAFEVADRFGELCARARERGLTVGIEPCPWTGIPDPRAAVAILERAGWPGNAGVLVDSWHVFRGCVELAALEELPGTAVLGIQLSDGTDEASVWTDWALMDETMRRRRLPGAGTFDLTGFLRALDATGCDVPVMVEVLSDDLRAEEPVEIGRRAGATARAALDAARADAPA
jgi:sugar phosphate isomerase/epimerase